MKNKSLGLRYIKGFTLIELLVVIAIIGILATVVLASLGSARDKSKDAAVKSQMSSLRAQAELFYSKKETFYVSESDNVCIDPITSNGFGGRVWNPDDGTYGGNHSAFGGGSLLRGIDDSVAIAVPEDGRITIITEAGGWNKITCHAAPDSWAVEAPLSTSTSDVPSMFCVDNSGIPKEKSTVLDVNITSC